MEFNMEKAQGLLDKEIEEAQQVLQDPSKVDDILMQLEEKLKEVPKIGETLSQVPLMIAMVKAWITKEYTEVSPKVIACLVGAIIYLIKKKDLISDNIPIIGIADDLGVMALALKLCEPELKAFTEWRAAKNGVKV
jgi:uncharacterized membrane protein YkvA (DUF1232 family)